MYISKYWGNYIGGTDDSLNLLDYLADKNKTEISLSEVFVDLGLDQLAGSFIQTSVPLEFVHSDGVCTDFHFAIDLITDLSAILLECKKSDGINLRKLNKHNMPDRVIRISATPEEYALVNQVLEHFASNPLEYDLSELVPEEDMLEMAEVCERLRQELEQ